LKSTNEKHFQYLNAKNKKNTKNFRDYYQNLVSATFFMGYRKTPFLGVYGKVFQICPIQSNAPDGATVFVAADTSG
jgi:hypothetical protein